MADVRQDVRIRGKPYEENFHETRFRLFLDGDGANACMCANGVRDIEWPRILVRDRVSSLRYRYAPRASTPHVKSFFDST